MASGTARAKSSYHPVVARAQRANRMCGNLDFASAASDPRDSGCIVGNSYLITLRQSCPSPEKNPQFSAQVGTPTPTDTAARSCGPRARVAPIVISSFTRVWSHAPVSACNSSNPALRQVQFPRLGQQIFAELTVGLLFHEAESRFLVNMTSCRENALRPEGDLFIAD